MTSIESPNPTESQPTEITQLFSNQALKRGVIAAMSGSRILRNGLVSAAIFFLAIPCAGAATFTFDTSADLTSNFNLDVVLGDNNTLWRTGYAAAGGFPGSDGGFVHFETINTSNSIQFRAGPVYLTSFQISSQFMTEGDGVTAAASAGNVYNLILYNEFFIPLLDQVLTIAPGGVWETLYFGLAEVSVIRVINPGAVGPPFGPGWWPNIDNIVVGAAVPLPAALPLFGTGLAAMGFIGWRRKRKAAA